MNLKSVNYFNFQYYLNILTILKLREFVTKKEKS